MIRSLDFEECVGPQIKPVFNRFGVYWDRRERKIWVECSKGSYTMPNEYIYTFIRTLRKYDHRPLRDEERHHLNALDRLGVLVGEMQDVLRVDQEWRALRTTYRLARKFCLITLKNKDAD